jgi:hypothetical protein
MPVTADIGLQVRPSSYGEKPTVGAVPWYTVVLHWIGLVRLDEELDTR